MVTFDHIERRTPAFFGHVLTLRYERVWRTEKTAAADA
jgi:hypothetical protein